MCFSASASFVVGTSLAGAGIVSLRLTKERCELPFASIPLLFAIQQLSEGFLWYSIENGLPELKSAMTYLFTLFSHILWPVFVPFAVARLESGDPCQPWRTNALWGFRVVGLVVSMFLLKLVATQPLTAVVDEHIVYVTPFFYDWPMMVLYIAATCIVCFFSTHALVRLFGLMVLLFFFVTWWFYAQALFSVWCFCAAVLSLVVFLHFRRSHALSVTE